MSTTVKQQKKLIRLMSALSDISGSLDAADLLIAGVSEELYQHVFLSMVVAYGRPFFENHGVGRIQCDYPNYPDFGDDEMPLRHTRLIDLRNKFLAHSSAEGTRIQIIPPGVENSLGVTPMAAFDFNIGKRTFPDVRYVEWLRVAPATFKSRIYSDIRQLLTESFSGIPDHQMPFELQTGYEKFQWT